MNKEFIIKILIICLLLLLATNIFLLTSSKNFENQIIKNNYTSNISGKLTIKLFEEKGKNVEWIYKKMTDFKSIDEFVSYMNNLPPSSSYFKSIINIPWDASFIITKEQHDGEGAFLVYPRIKK